MYLISFSGAKGNASCIYQLVAMRGLTMGPQGQMDDLPTQSNLCKRPHLKYIYFYYGVCKGVAHTIAWILSYM